MQSCISPSTSTDDQTLTTSRLAQLHAILTSPIVQSLLRLHPNELSSEEREAPSEWLEWQSWSKSAPRGWLELTRYYITGIQYSEVPRHRIPAALSSLLSKIREVQLPRDPIVLDALPATKDTGMSPKKVHEVGRMAQYVTVTIEANAWDPKVLRIVDIGAGQGYLTRALKVQLPRTRILALDADEAQTVGAKRWESRLLPPPTEVNPPITHKTMHVTPEELLETIIEWITEESSPAEDGQEIPVLLVGLHACGSLTLDVIRAFGQSKSSNKTWRFVAAVVVGCCYNLMNPGATTHYADFPLSRYMASLSPRIDLPTSAYHLAAQIPAQWLTSQASLAPTPSVELALRKVTWRALLGKKMQSHKEASSVNDITSEVSISLKPGRQLPWSRLSDAKMRGFDPIEIGTGATPELRRLGRLRDTAYQDWATFIDVAGRKMGVDFGSDASKPEGEREVGFERFLEVVHTLRCLVGPTVESTIILDRMLWLDEMLRSEGRKDVQTEFVNLFDQATGSGRNIAIVIAPLIPLIG